MVGGWAHRLRRHLPVALLAVALPAAIGASFVAWSMIDRASQADARARTAASLSARYAGASSAVADVQAAETRFVFMPSENGVAQLRTTQTALGQAIGTVRAAARTSSDRAVASQLAADARRVDTAIEQMIAAV